MKRAFDIHPGDRTHRRNLQAKLRDLRIHHGATQDDMGGELHLTHHAISRFENINPPNPQIITVQRYARTLDHRAELHLQGLPDTAGNPTVDLFTHRARSADPAMADAAVRALILAQLVAARTAFGVTQRAVADGMRCCQSSLCIIEQGESQPLLSTYQRYARVLGGKLTVAIVPAPTVDQVAVARAARGEVRFTDLHDGEREALFRDHAVNWPTNLTMRRFQMSHRTVQKWHARVGAEQVAA